MTFLHFNEKQQDDHILFHSTPKVMKYGFEDVHLVHSDTKEKKAQV